MSPFDFVNSINQTKKNLLSDVEVSETEYVPFVVNKSLSYFPETILYVNEVNRYSFLDNKLQYHYLLNSIRPAKRFAKWVKKENIEEIEIVREYYGYNTELAKQVLRILTPTQLSQIKEKLERGGNNDKNRNTS